MVLRFNRKAYNRVRRIRRHGKMTYYVKSKGIVLEQEVVANAYLEINAGKFGEVVKEVPAGAEVVDYSNSIISAGLVDTHIHGYKSHDVMDNDFEGIKVMSNGLLECGVTSWLPTTLTSSLSNIFRSLQLLIHHQIHQNFHH